MTFNSLNTCRPWASFALAALILACTAPTNAALLGRLPDANGVLQAFYDTDLNITWLANANLAATNTFGVPDIETSGGFNGPGSMWWTTAQAWIAAMNSAKHLGMSNWRLPTTTEPDPTCSTQLVVPGFPLQGFGSGCAGSEMGHLYNVDGVTCATPGVFSNITCGANMGTYWSGTQYGPGTAPYPFNDGYAFNLNPGGGQTAGCGGPYSCNAWPVVDGDPLSGRACASIVQNAVQLNLGNQRGSITGEPTSMKAIFQPVGGLANAESVCGVAAFDWQQSITNWPTPSAMYALTDPCVQANPLSFRLVCPGLSAPPAFFDPVQGGYTYNIGCSALAYREAFPFYFALNGSASDCFSLAAHEHGDVNLDFGDAPANACLPGGLFNLVGCTDPAGSAMKFKTKLVGVDAFGAIVKPDLYDWTWEDTFNGLSGGEIVTASASDVDPSSGTGGIRITSINGTPQTPPSVSCAATPNTLWPPNGKTVLTTLSGSITLGTSPMSGTSFVVSDSQSPAQQSGTVTMEADGTFSLTILLVASRAGNISTGRQYTITVIATDEIGNQGRCLTSVVVPHDQGH